MNEVVSGVYKITNKLNGKIYIGESTDIKTRIYYHKQSLIKKNHQEIPKNEFNNINDFEFEILEFVTPEHLREREFYYINLHDSTNPNLGYNKALLHKERVPKDEQRKQLEEAFNSIEPEDKYLTPKQLCGFLNIFITSQTLSRWRKEGMPCIQHGKQIRYDKDKVVEWMEGKKK